MEEIPERFDDMEELILKLEKNAKDDESFRELYGMVHTLKGTAGTFNINFLTYCSHVFEDFLNTQVNAKKNSYGEKGLAFIDFIRKYVEEYLISGNKNDHIYKVELKAIFLDPKKGLLRILLNEPNKMLSSIIEPILEEHGNFLISRTNHGTDALNRLIYEKYDVLITAMETGMLHGINLARMIKASDLVDDKFKVIILTSNPNLKNIEGVDIIIQKDGNLSENLLKILS